jgi:hypothetical protein
MCRYVHSAQQRRRFALLYPPDVNNCKKNALGILNKPFHVSHNTGYKIYPYSKNRFIIDNVFRFTRAWCFLRPLAKHILNERSHHHHHHQCREVLMHFTVMFVQF